MKLIIFDWGGTLYDPETTALFPETKPVLEALHAQGFTLAIVALATKGKAMIEEQQRIIEQEKLTPFFASIKFDVDNKEQMYFDTIQELSISPHETMIVDDRVMRGIVWGNTHGCTTVWVKHGKFADELPTRKTGEPDHTIASLSELQSILETDG
jgi:FMN phosphatase YigB (HAD superfamily)